MAVWNSMGRVVAQTRGRVFQTLSRVFETLSRAFDIILRLQNHGGEFERLGPVF